MAKASLRNILDASPRRTPGSGCKTCALLLELAGDDRDALEEYLRSDHPTRLISDALEAFGAKISLSAVSRHRRECPPLD